MSKVKSSSTATLSSVSCVRFGRLRRVVAAVVTGVLAAGFAVALAPAATAVPVAGDGTSSQTAAASCWAVKQAYPLSADGVYWLNTPALVQPEQFYCDMTTDGGGWVLVGRGREGWTFDYAGQKATSNVRSPVTGTSAFAPAALSSKVIDGLLDGGAVKDLSDGVRLRRAANTAGSAWQEVRLKVTDEEEWSWAVGGGIRVSSASFDGVGYGSGYTSDYNIDNAYKRIYTGPWANHGWKLGFSYGSAVGGENNSTSYLWEYTTENHAIPFTQVFIRPRITEADLSWPAISPAGLPAQELRPMISSKTDPSTPWGVAGYNDGAAFTDLDAEVLAFAQLGDTMYVGGKFTQVKQGSSGTPVSQPYLAAFDVDTGEWRSDFRPQVTAPVWEMVVTPEGRLIVGGEFTNVNGSPNTAALASVDPVTGATDTTWTANLQSQFTNTLAYVMALDVQDGWIYVGGQFTHVTGGDPLFGPVQLTRLTRVRTTDGKPDGVWKPAVTARPMEIDASSNGDRVYVVGYFDQVNGVEQHSLAVLDTVNGTQVPGLNPWLPSGAADHQQTILEYGDTVFQGGSEHMVHKYTRDDYTFEGSHISRRGGDYQAMVVLDGILYAACHCVDWTYDGTNSYGNPAPSARRVDPLRHIGAWDTESFLQERDFQPSIGLIRGEGPWELAVDSNSCLWAGGDINRGSYQSDTGTYQYAGGFVKFCHRDSTAPTTPTNLQVNVNGSQASLSWGASTDTGSSVKYEILKNDRVVATTWGTTWTDTLLGGPSTYWVRAIDTEGNRSATTAGVAVSPPAPVLAELIATNASWSYLADGSDQGTAWRNPGFDVSSWPTGATQIGWGDGDEATVLGTRPVTTYLVKTVNVADPSAYAMLNLELLRDDGAVVYVNGVEVARSNMPTGAVAYNTVASSYISGSGESAYTKFAVPPALLTAGANTVAVELHQAATNNGDASFALKLEALGTSGDLAAPSAPVLSVDATTQTTASLSWTASTDDVALAGYVVARDGTPVAYLGAATTSVTDSGLSQDTGYDYTVTAVDSSGNTAVSNTATATTSGNPLLLDFGAAWKWLYNGVDIGTTWTEPAYDDSTWASGPSELGYGDGDEATVIPAGSTPRPLTAYFRSTFDVANPGAVSALTLDVVRDDGAVVYINGVEVARSNMPAGTITLNTPASSGFWDRPTETTPVTFSVDPNVLVAGTNTIAVEVHQSDAWSGDLTFNLRLTKT